MFHNFPRNPSWEGPAPVLFGPEELCKSQFSEWEPRVSLGVPISFC